MIAIRGAVRVTRNDRESIYHDTQRLLREMEEQNGFDRTQVVSAFFTMTPDLNADFPAYAARSMGWTEIPMLGAQETPVPGAMDRMVRVLLHVAAPGPARHVYLGEAAAMRPDLASPLQLPVADGSGTGAEFGPVLVCGLGLIGGSLAMVLRRSGRFAEVLGQDRDARALELARAVGAVADADLRADLYLARTETVVLAMPVEGILAWLRRHGRNLRRGAIVLDVGSTKAAIVEAMNALPEGVEAIGTHPMAGSEEGGMGAARPDLFHGSTWALVETERTGPRARAVSTAIIEAAGARSLFVEPEEHDRAVAATSHLPYLLAGALALQVGADPHEATLRALAGPGLRDMTRLAASDPAVVGPILATNRTHLTAAIEGFWARLARLIERLEAALDEAAEALRDEAAEGLRDAETAELLAAEGRVPDALSERLAEVRRAREALFRS